MQCLGISEALIREPRKRAGIPRGLSHKEDRGARRKFWKEKNTDDREVLRSLWAWQEIFLTPKEVLHSKTTLKRNSVSPLIFCFRLNNLTLRFGKSSRCGSFELGRHLPTPHHKKKKNRLLRKLERPVILTGRRNTEAAPIRSPPRLPRGSLGICPWRFQIPTSSQRDTRFVRLCFHFWNEGGVFGFSTCMHPWLQNRSLLFFLVY